MLAAKLPGVAAAAASLSLDLSGNAEDCADGEPGALLWPAPLLRGAFLSEPRRPYTTCGCPFLLRKLIFALQFSLS